MKLQKYLLLVTMVSLVAYIVYSYQAICPNLTPQERLQITDAVFTAKAVEVGGGGRQPRTVTFHISRVWKGDVPHEITLTTKDYEKEGEYLIFAIFYKGEYYISLCGGRLPLQKAEASLKALGNPIKSY